MLTGLRRPDKSGSGAVRQRHHRFSRSPLAGPGSDGESGFRHFHRAMAGQRAAPDPNIILPMTTPLPKGL